MAVKDIHTEQSTPPQTGAETSPPAWLWVLLLAVALFSVFVGLANLNTNPEGNQSKPLEGVPLRS